jgi:hypothetical protein
MWYGNIAKRAVFDHKRLQLEVRASHIEKHLGMDKKIAA